MSIEEQYALLGRLEIEHATLLRRRGEIDCDLTAFGDGLSIVGGMVNAHIRCSGVPDDRGRKAIPDCVRKYADFDRLKALIAEREELCAELRAKGAALKNAFDAASD